MFDNLMHKSRFGPYIHSHVSHGKTGEAVGWGHHVLLVKSQLNSLIRHEHSLQVNLMCGSTN